MAGCGSNCSAGCCKDFSSRAERLPNLLSVEVTGEIFAKAVRNMTLRAAQRAAGMMSDEEYEEAKSKLVRWLVNAFSGENPHYEADSEWHGNGGLADYLAEMVRAAGAEAEIIPNPKPSPTGLVVKKGSKILPRCSSSIPPPQSLTVKCHNC